MQLVGERELPALLLLQATVPVGVVAPVPLVSLVETEQLVELPTMTSLSTQPVDVLVLRFVTVTPADPLPLLWAVSPEYAAVMLWPSSTVGL